MHTKAVGEPFKGCNRNRSMLRVLNSVKEAEAESGVVGKCPSAPTMLRSQPSHIGGEQDRSGCRIRRMWVTGLHLKSVWQPVAGRLLLSDNSRDLGGLCVRHDADL